MPTFREVYCQKHRCTRAQFEQRLFWRALYPHARPFVPLLAAINRNFFVADRTLIRSVAEAVTMRRVREDVRDYFWDSNNRGWLRRVANLRVSGQRVKNLARHYLPESDAGTVGTEEPTTTPTEGSAAPFEAPHVQR